MDRQKADRALAIVIGLFGVVAVLRWFWREAVWSEALFRMAEAALVGGVADWFAVSALFRRPLCVSFHTAIIPNNRTRIINALVYMVQEEFLSRHSIVRHLQKIQMVSLLIRWLENGGKDTVSRLLSKVMANWLREADQSQLSGALSKLIRNRLQAMKLHLYATNLADWLIKSGNADQLIKLALVEVEQIAAKPSTRQEIYLLLKKTTRQATGEGVLGKMFGAFLQTFDFINLEEAAAALQQRLQTELRDLEQPNHRLRLWLKDRLLVSLQELEQNVAWQTAIDEWKGGLIERIPLEPFLQPLIASLLRSGSSGEAEMNEHHPVIVGILRFTAKYWEAFRQDAAVQVWLERRLQEAAAEIVIGEHSLIGELVSQALGTLSDEELNSFIEEKVGEDLAWIRINGSVVGALAGLAVFFLGQYVYLPYLLPWLIAAKP